MNHSLSSIIVASAACLWIAGCTLPQAARPRATTQTAPQQLSKEDLQNALDEYDDFFESTIKQASSDIDGQSSDPAIRRAALLWKVRMIPANDNALKEPDPAKAFVNCWTLAVRMTQFFDKGEGRNIFGPQQSIAVEAAGQIEADIERVGTSFVPADKLNAAREDVLAFAAAHPIRDTFANAIARMPAAKEGAQVPFASILNIPLAPFRVAEGIDQGASAIRGFTDVAGRFTDIVQELPESVRWQLQLFLLDLDQSGFILSFLASFAELSGSTSRMANTAEKLPERLRQEASRLLDEIDAKQANLQATLERAEKTAATVERALQRVDVVAASIDTTGLSVAEAGRAWQGTAWQIEQTIQNIRHDRYPPGPTMATTTATSASPPPPVRTVASAPTTRPGRPFDILDYRDTANALTATAQELRALTAEVRATVESQKLSAQIVDVNGRVLGVVAQTSTHARSLTDHITWRIVELIALVFVVAIGYRVVARRLPPKKG